MHDKSTNRPNDDGNNVPVTWRVGQIDDWFFIIGDCGWIKGPFPTRNAAKLAAAMAEVGEDQPPEQPCSK